MPHRVSGLDVEVPHRCRLDVEVPCRVSGLDVEVQRRVSGLDVEVQHRVGCGGAT